MQIHQILVRPRDNTVIILYEDAVGNRNTIVVDSSGNATVSALIADSQQRLPPDTANPNRTQIEAQISELEDRLTALRQAIGVT